LTGVPASPPRIVLLGPPASGKGTHGRRLADTLGLDYLSTGALLREHVGTGSDIGLLAGPILARGGYLPDEVMCRMAGEWLAQRDGGWVLDGFPRSLPQALYLDETLAAARRPLSCAITLEVPLDELLGRVRGRVECEDCRWSGQRAQTTDSACPVCGNTVRPRADDDEKNFLSRHAEFERLTVPVLGHYEALGLLFRCNASAPKEHVAAMLLEHVRDGLR
jgi:adenylate kinase